MTTQLCKYYVGCLLLIRKFSQWKIPIVLFSTDRKINSKRMIAFSSIAFVLGKFSLHQSPFFFKLHPNKKYLYCNWWKWDIRIAFVSYYSHLLRYVSRPDSGLCWIHKNCLPGTLRHVGPNKVPALLWILL